MITIEDLLNKTKERFPILELSDIAQAIALFRQEQEDLIENELLRHFIKETIANS